MIKHLKVGRLATFDRLIRSRMASKTGIIDRVCIVRRDVCMGFSLYLKARSLVTYRPNILKLDKAAKSDMLFHFTDYFLRNY